MSMTMTASMAELGGTFRGWSETPRVKGLPPSKRSDGRLHEALVRIHGEEDREEEERLNGGPYRRKRFVAIEEVAAV